MFAAVGIVGAAVLPSDFAADAAQVPVSRDVALQAFLGLFGYGTADSPNAGLLIGNG